MEAGFITLAIAMAVLGTLLGMWIERNKAKRREIQGILNVAYDEYNNPELFLALSVPVEDIVSKDHTTFSVNVLRNNSHE